MSTEDTPDEMRVREMEWDVDRANLEHRLKAQGERITELEDALQIILPLAKGYAPAGQTASARAACRSMTNHADAVLESATPQNMET